MANRRYLNEYRVKLEPVGPGEAAIPYEYPYDVGKRTKFGGCPEGIQDDVEFPECGECGDTMYFLLQIDSFEHNFGVDMMHDEMPKHIDFMFGDVGVLYIFYCYECSETKCISQTH